MKEDEHWKEIEKGKEEDYFLRKHREWLEKKRRLKGETGAEEKAGALMCPRCVLPLHESHLKKEAILKCSGCGGGWIDAESLKSLLDL
jgi:hypothetical protein